MNKHDELTRLSAGLLLYADLFASLEVKIGSTNSQLSAIFEAAGNYMCHAAEAVDNILEDEENKSAIQERIKKEINSNSVCARC